MDAPDLSHPIGEDGPALAAALRTLDQFLGAAVESQARALGPASLLDPWRGLHLDRADVERLLVPGLHAELGRDGIAGVLGAAARAVPRLRGVATSHGLCDVDLALLLIALAPDVDLKYEKVYGYLQDDISRKRATPDLVANLLAFDAAQRLRVFARLGAAAPLQRAGLIELKATADDPWLSRPLTDDATWIGALLGREALDPSLAACAYLIVPPPIGIDGAAVEAALRARLRTFALDAHAGSHLLLSGPHGAGKFTLANAVAHGCGARLLVVDAREWTTPGEVRAQMQRAGRAGRSLQALVYVHGVARLAQRETQLLRALMHSLVATPARFVLASVAPVAPVPGVVLDAVRVEVAYPSAGQRAAIWQRALAARGLAAQPVSIDRIARRFAIGAGQIEQAVCDAAPGTRPPDNSEVSYADLARAARAQCGAQLAGLAQRITPGAGLDSLVVPPDVHAQLAEICARVTNREAVRHDWAAGSVHARVVGVTALFAGPSGTGKTLAAEAVAHELGFDLYRIDLASIVSKYIGETEQNLDRVFTAAEHANAVLLFDEADALFGKRSEVKDAHDRYANIEIAYLLQKMERFDGLAVLATNLKQNLDEAFARRLTFTLNFPFPEQAERRLLWQELWPPHAPREADVDLDWFASEFRLSGGNIRNTVLAAAHLAAADGRVVTRAHLLHATRREFQKLGKNLVDPTLGVNGRAA